MASTDKIRSRVGILNIFVAYWPAAASAWYIQGMVITALCEGLAGIMMLSVSVDRILAKASSYQLYVVSTH